jgi:hypothetical protein
MRRADDGLLLEHLLDLRSHAVEYSVEIDIDNGLRWLEGRRNTEMGAYVVVCVGVILNLAGESDASFEEAVASEPSCEVSRFHCARV